MPGYIPAGPFERLPVIEQLLSVGGQQLLLPVLIALSGLYAARGLFGLHGRMGQRRRDFIELWSSERAKDDLWLQVVVRHLFGCYLPAPVIRKVMGWPDAAACLLAIAEIWPMLTFDIETRAVRWKRPRHAAARRIGFERWLMLASYGVLATAAFAAAWISFRGPTPSLTGVTYAIAALALATVSLVLLMRGDILEVAYKRGPDLLARLNSPASPAPVSSLNKHVPTSIETSPT
jgi:hypothetical protein